MPKFTGTLMLGRCPHCSVADPNLQLEHQLETMDSGGRSKRLWGVYTCRRCGGVVTAYATKFNDEVGGVYPSSETIEQQIPERPRAYLQQAMESRHAPAGAVMLAASAVDAMLKLKGYQAGSLYARIEKAVKDHLITADMAAWAHDVRLDANDQRHADEAVRLPTVDEASRAFDFAMALADILFVLPARVQRGRGPQATPV